MTRAELRELAGWAVFILALAVATAVTWRMEGTPPVAAGCPAPEQ
jgi:hypothetical protein